MEDFYKSNDVREEECPSGCVISGLLKKLICFARNLDSSKVNLWVEIFFNGFLELF